MNIYQKIQPVIFIFLSICFSNIAICRNGQWKDSESIEDSAVPLANDLAGKLANKFIGEGAKVVFLNIGKCFVPGGSTDTWCQAFQNALENQLIAKGIRFLPEAERNGIRDKIASEQSYQQGSMQVDVSKAVELGKQRSIQAFATVEVNGDYTGKIRASAKSINIKDGVQTISEQSTLITRTENYRPISTYLKGIGTVGIGLGLAAFGHINDIKTSKENDKEYDKYKAAKDADTASAERKKVEDGKTKATTYEVVAGIGWLTALCGGWYLWASGENRYSYRIDVADGSITEPNNGLLANRIHWQPVFSNDFIGTSISLDL